jgi:catechol 2,3-dioxygenase
MGAVHLTVADLEGSLAFYRDAIGLELLARDGAQATLGAGATRLLELVEVPGAKPSPGRTGLFHFALLLPDRASLARWVAHAIRERVRLAGASDHYVSEAIYLSDPDRHGIEIYADRPRERWEGQVAERMGTDPLDLENLLAELDDPATAAFEGQPAGTTMGHVHLQVADVADSVRFYRDLGFGLMAEYGGQAAFLSAGGYHHHVGVNTWRSGGAPPPPPGSAALRRFEVVLPDAAARDALAAATGAQPGDDPRGPSLRDPSQNELVLLAA